MRIVWDIEYDEGFDETRVIDVREGLARWWLNWRSRNNGPKQWPPTLSHGVVDMSNAIYMLDVDTSAFETMLMCRPVHEWPIGSTVTWLEDELFPRIVSLALWGEWDWIEA